MGGSVQSTASFAARSTAKESLDIVSTRRRFDQNVDYYAILEVAADATQEEITRSYRQLMRGSHPDRFPDPAERHSAEERAKEINAAYAVLSRPDVRREYDGATRERRTAGAIRARYATPRSPVARRQPTYTQRASAARRPAPAGTIQAQRSSFSKAIRQVLVTFLTITLILIALILTGAAAWAGLRMLVG